jgi:hypothetical protein
MSKNKIVLEVDYRIKVADLLISQAVNESFLSSFSIFRAIVRYQYVYPDLKVSELLEIISQKQLELFVQNEN